MRAGTSINGPTTPTNASPEFSPNTATVVIPKGFPRSVGRFSLALQAFFLFRGIQRGYFSF
jgi:hypothetical protein